MRFAFVNQNGREGDKKSAMKKSPLICRNFDAPRDNARRKNGSRPRLTLPMGPLGVALCALLIYGCSASASRGDTQAGPQAANAANVSPEQCLSGAVIQTSNDQQNYHIQPGDQLAINFYLNPEFNDEVPVSPDGRVTLRLVGAMAAAGMTPSELAGQIDKAYLTELRSPDAAVIVKNMPGRQIYVQGQVNHPGAFPLEPGMTALQALADAGGITPDAADDNVVLIRRDACGRPTGERLDLASAADNPGKGEDAALMPYDVLVVPRSRIANMDLFVKQYIRDLLPIQPYLSMTPGL
jgi:polysaccharide biosynthesis/export protein